MKSIVRALQRLLETVREMDARTSLQQRAQLPMK